MPPPVLASPADERAVIRIALELASLNHAHSCVAHGRPTFIPPGRCSPPPHSAGRHSRHVCCCLHIRLSQKSVLRTFASNQSIRHSTSNLPSTPHLECCLHSGESANTTDASPAPAGVAACQACGGWPSATASPDPVDRGMKVVAYSLQIYTGTCFSHSIMDEPARSQTHLPYALPHHCAVECYQILFNNSYSFCTDIYVRVVGQY